MRESKAESAVNTYLLATNQSRFLVAVIVLVRVGVAVDVLVIVGVILTVGVIVLVGEAVLVTVAVFVIDGVGVGGTSVTLSEPNQKSSIS